MCTVARRSSPSGKKPLLLERGANHWVARPEIHRGDLTRRPCYRLFDDLDAVLLVFVCSLDSLERLDGAQQRDAAARQDAFLDRGAGCVHCVIDRLSPHRSIAMSSSEMAVN